MRILPDKPSVAFLRKEAKDLLAALRESNPTASLTDAQRALATQYGMRDWTELRSDVEQRAAAAPVAPAGLADAIAAAFGLGRVTSAASPVSFTLMGRCWSIATDRGRWLAVTVWDWITEEQAEIGVRLRDAAAGAGVAAPTPVRSPRGRLIEAVRGQHWKIQEWMEVGPPPVTPTQVAVARRIGGTFGTLHSLALPSETPIGPYLTSRRPRAAWESLVEEARTADKPWVQQLDEALPAIFELHTIQADLGSNSFILCNRNINPENVRVGHNDRLVVVEWDFVGSLTPELEIGWALTHWALHPSINHKAIVAFHDGYAEAAGRWPKLELASFAIAVTGYLNWVYQTVCAAMNSTDTDHVAFAEGETADLLRQPMTRALLQELLSAVEE